MASYRVVGAIAVVDVAGTSRYLDRGAVLPDGVTNLEHLLSVGLVAEVVEPKTGESKTAAKK